MSMRQLLNFWKPIGCIVENGPAARFSLRAFGDVPVVYLNTEPNESYGNVSVVHMENSSCVHLAVNELLRGPSAQLGYVPFLIPARPWDVTRQDTFRRLLLNKGIPFSVFTPIGRAKCISRIEFIRQVRPWLRKLAKPCGILAANDEMASIVSVALSMEKLEVPQDVALIGIDDDTTICLNTSPQLSSVRPNFAKGAYMAAKLLDRIIRHPDWPARHVAYPPDGITRRESTLFTSRSDACVSKALELIDAKACTGLTAHDVLQTFPCSPRSANARFRSVTGLSILEAIHAVRLRRMKDLLANQKQTLGAVANVCGYQSLNAACKFFRLKTGFTMTAWRKRHL